MSPATLPQTSAILRTYLYNNHFQSPSRFSFLDQGKKNPPERTRAGVCRALHIKHSRAIIKNAVLAVTKAGLYAISIEAKVCVHQIVCRREMTNFCREMKSTDTSDCRRVSARTCVSCVTEVCR